MEILITGGAGFIGSHLCEELAKDDNNNVYSLDNYLTGSEDNHVDNVTYIKGDTQNIDKLVRFTPDIVYHLGEYSRVESSFANLEKVWSSNKNGTFKVLEFCRENNAKIVYAGSSTKFGDGGMGRSQSPYAWSKASNTELVKNYGEWFGLKYAITYFYNAYGKREVSKGEYATLIAIFADRMKLGDDLSVVLPGTQKRNFTHVDDIVSGLILVGENGFGDEYGIGSDESYTVEEIATFFGGRIKYLPPRKGNRLSADLITEKTLKLGWKSNKSVLEYINLLKENNWNI